MHREMASGLAQEEAPGFGGGLAQRHGADLDAGAGDGRPLVRCATGVAEDHLDLLERDVQLFGDDLRQCRADAGTKVDVAAEGGDLAVRGNGDERVDLVQRQVGGALLGKGEQRAGRLTVTSSRPPALRKPRREGLARLMPGAPPDAPSGSRRHAARP